MTTPCWTYSAGENAGEPVVWSELIAKLHGWRIPRGDDLRWCPHGAEHEMAVSLAGHACERCGVAVLHVERPQVVVLGEVYARTRGPRPCRKCGEPFESQKLGYHTCPRCYRFEPPATRRQTGYLVVLAGLLGVDVPVCRTPADAARAIDELLLLIDADPDIVRCAAGGCDWFVNRTRVQAHTFCRQHRNGASGRR